MGVACTEGRSGSSPEHEIQDALFRGLLALLDSEQDATEMLEAVRAYSLKHFDTEESLMRRLAYPESAAHRVEHARLRQELSAMCALGADNDSLADVAECVMSQVRRHVDCADRRLAAYLAVHGERQAATLSG